MTKAFYIAFIALLFTFNYNGSFGQIIKKGTVIHVKVYGKALEGNLEGDDANRSVSIYLPASYSVKTKKHYPVVYFLHGFTDDDSKWYGLKKHWINLPNILDTVFSEGKAAEMIFVTPDAYTKYKGSMYSNSVTTGNWEDFVAKDLIAYVDRHYRTIPKAASRGLCGHSMGGYGTMRIGSHHPDIFSAIYMLSPASLMPDREPDHEALARLEAIKTPEDAARADFGIMYAIASSAAWSPNPDSAPFCFEMPVKNGQIQQNIYNKWVANMPLTTLDQYIGNLKQLHGIGFDAGTKDINISASIKVLDEELNKYGIRHQYESYVGNHTDHIAQRIKQRMVLFFSENLATLDAN